MSILRDGGSASKGVVAGIRKVEPDPRRYHFLINKTTHADFVTTPRIYYGG